MCEGENLTQICADKDMPSRRSVVRWLISINPSDELKQWRLDYANAREALADVYFEEVTKLCEELPTYADSSHARVIQMRIDSRKWVCARMAPWKYSEHRINENKTEITKTEIKVVDTGITAAPGSKVKKPVADDAEPEYMQ